MRIILILDNSAAKPLSTTCQQNVSPPKKYESTLETVKTLDTPETPRAMKSPGQGENAKHKLDNERHVIDKSIKKDKEVFPLVSRLVIYLAIMQALRVI